MRTGSHQVTGTILAAGFLGGWLSASWIAPAPVTTQVAPARRVSPAPTVVIPRVALSQVQAPEASPTTTRNPFVFRERVAAGRGAPVPAEATSDAPDVAVATDSVDAPVAAAPGPSWRLVGLATAADGAITAILTGEHGLHLVAAGARLPDGATVSAIDGTRVTLTLAGGATQALDLP